MRQKLKQTLETYGTIAKDLQKPGLTELERERLSTVLGWHQEKAATAAGIPLDRQEKIYRLQAEKQLRMEELHEQLRKIDRGEPAFPAEPDARQVIEREGVLFCAEPGRSPERITIGEICADRVWGIPYAFDATVQKRVLKRFAIEEMKRELERYLDVQVATEEGPRGNRYHRMKYAALIKDRQNPVNLGHLAERMVNGFLLKLTLDAPVDFRLEYADVYHDIEQKIDLIIRRTPFERGIRIETVEAPITESTSPQKTRGVQLMTGKTAAGKTAKIARSMEQLKLTEERVQEIILLKIGKQATRDALARWERDGRPPGGPDAYWSPEQQFRLLHELLKGLFTEEEIRAQWEKAQLRVRRG